MQFESVAYARKALEAIVDGGLQANDQAMIVGSRDRGATPVAFTGDGALLRQQTSRSDIPERGGFRKSGIAVQIRRQVGYHRAK